MPFLAGRKRKCGQRVVARTLYSRTQQGRNRRDEKARLPISVEYSVMDAPELITALAMHTHRDGRMGKSERPCPTRSAGTGIDGNTRDARGSPQAAGRAKLGRDPLQHAAAPALGQGCRFHSPRHAREPGEPNPSESATQRLASGTIGVEHVLQHATPADATACAVHVMPIKMVGRGPADGRINAAAEKAQGVQ
jgi:hypothetical protein